MDINDIAAKGAHAIACRYGKKVLKHGTAPAIPESKTITLTGDAYRLGFARKDINPEEFGKITYGDFFSCLDYLKVGSYISNLGGLDSKTTNQRLYSLKGIKTEGEFTDYETVFTDITYKLQK